MPNYVNIAWERALALAFLATLFYLKNQSLNIKKVLQAKKSGSPSREREQRQDKGCFAKNSWVGVARD